MRRVQRTIDHNEKHGSIYLNALPASSKNDWKRCQENNLLSYALLHVGTNELKKLSPNRVAERIVNIATQIQGDSPRTEVVISGLLTRPDKLDLSVKVNETNKLINTICCKSKWKLINATCLNSRGLHHNRKGTSVLAKKLSSYIKSN